MSDQAALEAIAARRARDLDAEGACILPLGGATSMRRFLALVGPHGLDVRLLGLCDVGEERHFRHALESAGMGHDLASGDLDELGFFVCPGPSTVCCLRSEPGMVTYSCGGSVSCLRAPSNALSASLVLAALTEAIMEAEATPDHA